MVDAFGERLDVAVEHRRVGLDAERVRDPVDLTPALRVRLARVAQELRHARREDLGPAARHRLEAGGLEPRERVLRLDSGAAPEVVDLRGGERLDLNLGTRGVERGDHPLVVLEGPVGVMAADDVDLAHLRADHSDDVLDGVLEGAVLALLPGESAEGAREHADVGG